MVMSMDNPHIYNTNSHFAGNLESINENHMLSNNQSDTFVVTSHHNSPNRLLNVKHSHNKLSGNASSLFHNTSTASLRMQREMKDNKKKKSSGRGNSKNNRKNESSKTRKKSYDSVNKLRKQKSTLSS